MHCKAGPASLHGNLLISHNNATNVNVQSSVYLLNVFANVTGIQQFSYEAGNLQLESNVIIWEQIVFANVRKNYATYVLAARQVANIQTKNVKIEKLNLPPK